MPVQDVGHLDDESNNGSDEDVTYRNAVGNVDLPKH